jgi:drug/metabolite transporter (DMT)-like permease
MKQLVLMGAMVFAAFFGGFGQIFLKKASLNFSLKPDLLLTNWWFYAFIFAYGIGVVINILAYKAGGKVTFLYPVIALSYIFAAFLAWKLLDESISALTWAGIITIIIGVSLIGFGAANGGI